MKQFDIVICSLDPTTGAEMQKTRPVVIVSPDSMNRHLRTVIVAPLTSTHKPWPFRITLKLEGKQSSLALDHIRAVDKTRLTKRIGRMGVKKQNAIKQTLQEMFS